MDDSKLQPGSGQSQDKGLDRGRDEGHGQDLAPRPDLAFAKSLLSSWTPPSPDQAAVRERMLDFVAEHPRDAHLRTCVPGHLTASAILLDAARERVLLTHHKKLGRWLQFGGHCDGDANLRGVSWRETVEESGITPAWMSPIPIDLDIHVIPARKQDPEHLHLDTRFLAVAPEGAHEVCSEESHALGWFDQAAARALDLDDSLQRLLDFAFRR